MNKIKEINNKLFKEQFGYDWERLAGIEHEPVTQNYIRKYESIFRRFKQMKSVVNVPVRLNGKTGQGISKQCHSNVAELVDKIGGKAVRGYWLHRMKNGSMTAFIWHSIWETPEGKWVDVTASATKDYSNIDHIQFVPVVTMNPFEDDYYFIKDFIVHDNRHLGIKVRRYNGYENEPFNWFKKILVKLENQAVAYSKSECHKRFLENYGSNVFDIIQNRSNDKLSFSSNSKVSS